MNIIEVNAVRATSLSGLCQELDVVVDDFQNKRLNVEVQFQIAVAPSGATRYAALALGRSDEDPDVLT